MELRIGIGGENVMEKNQYDWVDFYREFASILLDYKNRRDELIEKVEAIYAMTGISMPTLERDNQLVDIDPFTVFGLFNKKLTDENRMKILAAIAELFGVKTAVPTSFDSLPVLNPQNATFYYFVDQRGAEDIDDLWSLYESALAYAQSPTVENRKAMSRDFNLVMKKRGSGNSKITMALYWIAPDVFLNLDKRNEWYIYESGKLPAIFVKQLPKTESKMAAAKYFEIIEALKRYLQSDESPLKDFKELSFEAWVYSEQVNKEKSEEKEKHSPAVLADEDVQTKRYWIYSPGEGSCMWDEFYDSGIMAIGWGGMGDLTAYDSKDAMKTAMKATYDESLTYRNAAHLTWQFANEMKIGDVVFVKKGMHRLIGRGIVMSDYEFDDSRNDEFKHIRQVKWTHRGDWPHPGQAVMKTLTDITPYTDYVEKLKAIFENESEEDIEEVEQIYPIYTKDDFLSDVYMSEEEYEKLAGVLRTKKNIVLQGAPGVGKTFAAKRLAFSMMGVKDVERVMMIQFHQSYSYEDFIMGFRPSSDGFELRRGAFYNFCKKAEIDGDKDYFFIIDEINRGNLSKIFGELFMLIENDKRGVSLQLLYSDEKFAVPKNIYIIGMMNTADRSLAMLDYALRRRFAFFEIKPGFGSEGFEKYKQGLENEKFDRLIACVEDLNNAISVDETLGEGFCIGHSYFCNLSPDTIDEQILSGIVEYELIPLLKEYWFDEPTKVENWIGRLRSAIQ